MRYSMTIESSFSRTSLMARFACKPIGQAGAA
jgi:hypothetical protein